MKYRYLGGMIVDDGKPMNKKQSLLGQIVDKLFEWNDKRRAKKRINLPPHNLGDRPKDYFDKWNKKNPMN